ncbi:VOC family protein [Burkholderia pyrrocinia]|uniref:VOC family protein n=1 Tax=Burkholderia pyrrocinia TaxID=60550 RepID=UPI001576B500|nr:VOC family protein [Burkholderia pyrrocinia]NTX26747.1 VOC family protein [Burkholderia pyrrocinia]
MSIGITGFDHSVIAVRNMDESRIVYQKLGFTVPPRGSHIEWGTGNWCIMFENSYHELRGIVDAARYTHGLENFLEKREGQMGIAFRSNLDNRELHQQAVDAGLHPAAPRELTRNFELKTGNVPVSFRLVFFDPKEAPSLMASLVCQHLTPERLRKPEYLDHPNTANDIVEITSVSSDLRDAEQQLATLFGAENTTSTGREVRAILPDGGIVRVLETSASAAEGLALDDVDTPYLSSIAIRVARLAAVTQVLEANGVPFSSAGKRIRIAPAHACGTYLEFTEE